MAFTPSNLYTVSLGSSNQYHAFVNGSALISGPNSWVSGITDIISVIGQNGHGAVDSESGLFVSFTSTSGTIWVDRAKGNSGSSLTLIVTSGGYTQDVQDKP